MVHRTLFTAFIQNAALKREEQKVLFDAFSLIGQDRYETDLEFALHAQQEVIDSHN